MWEAMQIALAKIPYIKRIFKMRSSSDHLAGALQVGAIAAALLQFDEAGVRGQCHVDGQCLDRRIAGAAVRRDVLCTLVGFGDGQTLAHCICSVLPNPLA